MIITGLLWWLFTGFVAWVFNLKNIIGVARDLFVGARLAFKIGYYAVTFFTHIVGGGVSLIIFLYSKYRQWRRRDENS